MTAKSNPKTPPGKNGFNYRRQYGIVVVCDGEAHQSSTYARLMKMGLKLKVVVV